MNGHCYIFSAGDLLTNPHIDKDSYIIAADAGYMHTQKLGLTPDLLVGDFDSIERMPDFENTVRYPAEKDCTDTELAINIGLEKGFDSFTVFGALGGDRLEHTIANLQLAAGIAKQGKHITLSDGITVIKAIHNTSIDFSEDEQGYISVFSFDGDAKGVTLKGLKYELYDVTLPCTGTLGVSNEFTRKPSSVSVKDGTLIIIYRRKDGGCNEA